MYRYRSHLDAHAISECSHTTSYVKMISGLHAGIGGRSGRSGTLVSLGSLSFQSPEYVCFTEYASTSKPTMRAPVKVSDL